MRITTESCPLTFEPSLALTGHADPILDLEWSPDGELLASSSKGGVIRVWNGDSGVLRHEIRGHASDVRTIAWLPGGNGLASGSRDQTVRIWDSEGRSVRRLDHAHQIDALAACPKTGRIAVADRRGWVTVWDENSTARPERFAAHTGQIVGMVWSPDGSELLTASNKGLIRVWQNSEVIAERDLESPVQSTALSADGRWLAVCGDGIGVRVFEKEGLRQRAVPDTAELDFVHVRFARYNGLLAGQSKQGCLLVWNSGCWTRAGQVKTSRFTAATSTVAFHPSAPQLATVKGNRRVIQLWHYVPAREPDPELASRNKLSVGGLPAATSQLHVFVKEGGFQMGTTNIRADRGAVVTNQSKVRDANIQAKHVSSAENAGLQQAIDELALKVEAIDARYEDERAAMQSRLEEVARLAAKPAGDRQPRLLEVSAKGLVEAAKTVGDIVPGLVNAARTVAEAISG